MAVPKRKDRPTRSDSVSQKKRKLDSLAANSPAPHLSHKDEEVGFERGGASILTPLEKKQIKIKARNDALFEEKTGKSSEVAGGLNDELLVKRKTRASKEDASVTRRKAGSGCRNGHSGGDSFTKVERPESLSYNKLHTGALVLGQVSKITKRDITLALPNNLVGFVAPTSISCKISEELDALAEESSNESMASAEWSSDRELRLDTLVTEGQYLRAFVASTRTHVNGTTDKKHIELSIKPSQANSGMTKADLVINAAVQAEIASVEDHGLVMDLGLDGTSSRGFIPSQELGPLKNTARQRVGMVLLCSVIGISSNGRVCKLSADPSRMGNLTDSVLATAPTVNAFLPGTAAKVRISTVDSSGFCGNIMGFIDATADSIHANPSFSSGALDKLYSRGSKVKTRITYVLQPGDLRKVGCSVRKHVTSLSSPGSGTGVLPTSSLPISTTVDHLKVERVEPGLGLVVTINGCDTRGFVHISRICDEKVGTISGDAGPYQVGSVHRGRIIGYNRMDDLFTISFEKRILDLPFLSIDDVKVGQILKGTISKMIINASGVTGVLVKIAEGISGLVPEIHLADVSLRHPERKFVEGLPITARVLSIDSERSQLRLTLKKTLINTDSAIWKDFEELEVGMQSPGTLISISDAGAIVQFYGSVRGFLPVSLMSESHIRDPKHHFRIGQVLNVRIISIDHDRKRMTLSCKASSSFGPKEMRAFESLTAGTIVEGDVSEKTQTDIIVELHGSKLKACLPYIHLTDGSKINAMSIARSIRVGQKLTDMVVMNRTPSKFQVQVTTRPSLREAFRLGAMLKSFDDIQIGRSVTGFVKNITSSGVFVQFADDILGLLPKNQLPPELLPQPDFTFSLGQSISAEVLSVDSNERRFVLTKKVAQSQEGNYTDATVGQTRDQPLSNPVDDCCKTTGDLFLGKVIKARIMSVKDTQLNMQLADGVQGRVDVSVAFNSWDEIVNKKYPMKQYKPKQVLLVRILGIHDSRNHRYLPISHKGKAPVFELSARKADIEADKLEVLTLDKIEVGSTQLCFVNNTSKDFLWVNLSPNVRGRIPAFEASDDPKDLINFPNKFKKGAALRAQVTHVDLETSHLDLSARSNRELTLSSLDSAVVGTVLLGRITKIEDKQIMVQLSDSVAAPVHLVDLLDDYSKADTAKYRKDQIILVHVNGVDVPKNRLYLSTRVSKTLNPSAPVRDPEITSFSQLKVNDLVRGFVKNVSDKGLFVSLATNLTAFVRVSDLSDQFIKDWKPLFPVNHLVKGRIVALDEEAEQIRMTLKQSAISEDYKPILDYSDLKVGQIISGKIRKVEDFGVFVVFDNSMNVSGLCHCSEMAETPVRNVKEIYKEGDEVKAKVLKIDVERRRVSLGMKSSHLDADIDTADEDSLDETSENGDRQMSAVDELPEERGQVNVDSLTDRTFGSEQRFNGNGIYEPQPKSTQTNEPHALLLPGFDWTGDTVMLDSAPEEAFSDNATAIPQRRKHKKAEFKVDKTADLDSNGPQSVADFERLLLGQPNSSYLWLSYMAFHLQSGDVGKARGVAERAINTINRQSRETEQDAVNVWVGLINLENAYGDEESVDRVFKRACETNDVLEMHNRLISVYIQSGKNEASPQNRYYPVRHLANLLLEGERFTKLDG